MRALAHHELALHSLNLGRFDDVGPHLDEADAWDRDPNAQVFDDDRAQSERLVFRACLRALWHFLRDEGTEAPFVELWEHNDHPFARTYIGLFAAQVHQLLDDARRVRGLWAERSLASASAADLHVFEVTVDVGVAWAEAPAQPPDPAAVPAVVERLTGPRSGDFEAGMIDRYSHLLAADLALRAGLAAGGADARRRRPAGRGARYFDVELPSLGRRRPQRRWAAGPRPSAGSPSASHSLSSKAHAASPDGSAPVVSDVPPQPSASSSSPARPAFQ